MGMTNDEIAARLRQIADDLKSGPAPLGRMAAARAELALLAYELTAKPPPADPLDGRVDELEISPRAFNCLRNEGVETIRQVVAMSDFELLRMWGFGRHSLADLKLGLKEYLEKTANRPGFGPLTEKEQKR
jgi:DNA-directed RNA polymerase alpha subunit